MRDLKITELFHVIKKLMTVSRTMSRAPKLSVDETTVLKFKKIQDLVAHAYTHVPFYRSLYEGIGFQPGDLKTWDNFAQLPLVSKDDVIKNYPDRMISAGYLTEDLVVSRSSGSSGKVLDIAYDSDAMTTYIVAALRLYKMCFSYKPWHKQLYVYTSPYPMTSLLGFYKLIFVPTLTPVDKIIRELKNHRPELLVCYPSHLKEILQETREADRKAFGIRAVSVNSEMSTQSERDHLSSLLNCPVLDEYSSEELTRIAAQCLDKTYHVFEDINHMETVNANGQLTDEAGLLVGTNLHNRAMPMIRYQQNDIGKISFASCTCHSNFRHLTHFEGRRNDSFTMPSGKILSSGFLLDATYDFLLKHRDAVKDFCLIQQSSDRIVLQVIRGEGWSEAVNHDITSSFKSFLEESMVFDIDLVDVCEKTTSGKRNPIINLMNRAT